MILDSFMSNNKVTEPTNRTSELAVGAGAHKDPAQPSPTLFIKEERPRSKDGSLFLRRQINNTTHRERERERRERE